VIAVELQGHGRTADIKRDFSYEHLADDVAALLDYLKIPSADLIGYSMGGRRRDAVCDPPSGNSA
jgi:pimeloyl-ACP methyl ester carboxylesterase